MILKRLLAQLLEALATDSESPFRGYLAPTGL